MARQPFRPVELTEALRPVAAPVDGFIHAQEPSRDTNLQDLARSLSGLGGSLAGMVGERDRKAEEDDKVRGEAAYWQTNGTGAAEAVAKGLIPAQASPAYLKAYKRLEGEVAGGQLEQKFASAYDTWEGKSSTDPKAYDEFLGSFIKSNITTEDPDVLRGLLPKVHQVAANYLQRHIGDASKATQAGYSTALSARGEQAIDEANTAGLSSKTGTDYQGVFGRLEAIRADGLKVGANQEQVDQKLIDTVTASAIAKRDPKLLDFLDRKVPGQDYTWSNTPYGRDQKQKTIDALETMGRKSIAEEERKNKEEQKAVKDDTTRKTIKAITENPNGPLPEELLAQGEKVDPDFRVNAITWRNTIAKAGGVSDPEAVLGVTSDIINGGGLGRVQKAMRDGVFKNPADLTRAYKLAESMDKGGADIGAIMKGGSAKTILDTIKVRTANGKDASRVFDDGSVSPEGLQAQTDFKLQILAWKEAHPTANAIEQEKAISGIGADILKRIQQPEEMGAVGFDRTGIDGPNTFGANAPPKALPEDPEAALAKPVTKPPAAPGKGPVFGDPSVTMPSGLPGDTETQAPAKPATPPAPTPAKPAAPVDPEAAADWFNKLTPEVRQAVELKAAQEKKPLTLKAQELFQKGVERGAIPAPVPKPGKQSSTTMKAPDGTPIEAASMNPEDATRQVMDAFERAMGPAVTTEQAAKAPRIAGGAPPTAIPSRLITEKGPTPVPANAAVAVVMDGPRANINHGVISLKGPDGSVLGQYQFVNGGGGAGTIPHGAYDVTNYRDRGTRSAQGLTDLGETFDLSDVFDAKAGRDRTQLRIHQAHGEGTLGCIGIQGGEGAWQDFSKKMQGLVAKGGGKYTLVLGAGEGGAPSSQDTTRNIQDAFARAMTTEGAPQGGYSSAALRGDPKAARILDFVAGPESRGNYNAFYGNAGSTKDLSAMSFDEVVAWSGNRGTESSATGRYQFMKATLGGLKTELGLTGSEKFTPELQDRMAVQLLNRRGYSEWQAGRITDAQFANRLALEWASLPNITAQNGRGAGQSAYAGDGRNKSLVSPSQVMAALTGSGAFPAARVQQAAAQAVTKSGFLGRVRSMFSPSPAPTPGPAEEAPQARSSVPPALQARNEQTLGGLEPDLAAAIRKAQADNPQLAIAVTGSGRGAQVHAVNRDGRTLSDPASHDQVAAAIRRSSSQLGVGVKLSVKDRVTLELNDSLRA